MPAEWAERAARIAARSRRGGGLASTQLVAHMTARRSAVVMMLLVMVGRTWCAGGREGGRVGGRTAAGVIINTLFIWAHPKTAKENLSRPDLFTLCPGPSGLPVLCRAATIERDDADTMDPSRTLTYRLARYGFAPGRETSGSVDTAKGFPFSELTASPKCRPTAFPRGLPHTVRNAYVYDAVCAQPTLPRHVRNRPPTTQRLPDGGRAVPL